jgi:hypothetical protein
MDKLEQVRGRALVSTQIDGQAVQPQKVRDGRAVDRGEAQAQRAAHLSWILHIAVQRGHVGRNAR